MKFYPRYVGDWKKKTAALTLLEKGVYSELLDYCYATEEPLPADNARIMAIVGAKSAAEYKAVGTVLEMFFKKNGKGWENERAQEEISAWHEKSGKASASAAARWAKERDKRAPGSDDEQGGGA